MSLLHECNNDDLGLQFRDKSKIRFRALLDLPRCELSVMTRGSLLLDASIPMILSAELDDCSK